MTQTLNKPSVSAARAEAKKSGLKIFKQGELIFNENDIAESLFIIQKGQLRLFRPKGRGFVELAILRAGEVIGEMAYFDEKARKRSCSASAIVKTEVVEISFNAFEKTMAGLNPWFKTIINTLAERLRKTNERVKELESNSVGYSTGGKAADYKFFLSSDIVKLLSMIYLVIKAQGEVVDGKMTIHYSKFKFYIVDCFNFAEIKLEEFLQLMKNEKLIELALDDDQLPKNIKVKSVDLFRSLLIFFNTQRTLAEEKMLRISPKCQDFLKKILDQFAMREDVTGKETEVVADISAILKDYKAKNVTVSEDDLREGIDSGLLNDLVVGEGNKLTSVVNYVKLKQLYPSIKVMNAINKLNASKVKSKH